MQQLLKRQKLLEKLAMNKETMLYIRHSFHSKTKSNDFLIEILKEYYDITVYDIDPYTQDDEIMLKQIPIKDVDVLLLFQLPISGDLLKKYINFKKGVFFPMYDGAPSRNDQIWLSWKDFNIINFSKTLHNELLQMGFSSFYIQYFPKPIDNINNFGEINSVFFWQRITNLNIKIFKDIFKVLNIKKVHLHKAIDPTHKFVEPTENDKYEIEYSSWYENKNEMLNDIKKSALYVAPRLYEGIGMSFLEAMAMGRCVISPNNPTMNEYIEDGVTGILYDFNIPKIYKKFDIRQIQMNTYKYICEGYKKFEIEKHNIISFINSPTIVNLEKIKKIKFVSNNRINVLKKIFSITNSKERKHKIITILGIKIKIKKGAIK